MILTIKKLREQLANYPDDYKVVVESHYYNDFQLGQLTKNHEITKVSSDDISKEIRISAKGI